MDSCVAIWICCGYLNGVNLDVVDCLSHYSLNKLFVQWKYIAIFSNCTQSSLLVNYVRKIRHIDNVRCHACFSVVDLFEQTTFFDENQHSSIFSPLPSDASVWKAYSFAYIIDIQTWKVFHSFSISDHSLSLHLWRQFIHYQFERRVKWALSWLSVNTRT